MSGYVHGRTRTGSGQRRLDHQNAAMVERNKAIDARHRAERRNALRRKDGRVPPRPFAEVFAESEVVRQWAVANMTIAFYEEGTARLRAATEEVDQRRMARYNRTAQRNRTNQGREAA